MNGSEHGPWEDFAPPPTKEERGPWEDFAPQTDGLIGTEKPNIRPLSFWQTITTPLKEIPHPSFETVQKVLTFPAALARERLEMQPDEEKPSPILEKVAQAIPSEKATAIATGAIGAGADLGSFFTSPLGISTLGIGYLPKLAQRAVALGFAGQMASQTPELARELGTELAKPEAERDYAKITNLAVSGGLNTFLAGLGAVKGLAPGKVKPTTQRTADAETIRRNQEKLSQAGQIPEGGQEAGGYDVQRPPPGPPDVAARPSAPPDTGIDALKPAVKLPTGDVVSEAPPATHAEILKDVGVPPKEIPHADPARGFVTKDDPQTLLSRKQAEKVAGVKGTAKAGGLDSQDLAVESVTPLEPQSGAPLPAKEVPPQIEQLHAGLEIPGIDKFIKNDVKPLLQRGVDAVKASKDIILKLVAPVTQAKPSDVDVLFAAKGYKDELLFKANTAVEGAKKQMARLPTEEQVAFIDRVKRGQPQPTPELQKTADLLRAWDDRLYNEVKKYKPDLPYLDNHLRVLWKVIPGTEPVPGTSKAAVMGRRPWQGSRGFLKKHVLEDISEGIKLGGVPVSYNPIELFSLHAQDVMKFVAANRAWEGLKKTGAVEFVRRGDAPPEGYTRINDGIARVYFKTEKGLVSPGEWWVEPGAARMINNYLSRDWIRGNALGRGLMDLKNATTAIELGLSPFHAVFETNETIGSSLGLGLAKMFSGKIAEGAKDIVTAIGSPRTTAKIGSAAIRFAKNPEEFRAAFPETYDWFTKKYPNAKELLQDLFLGGGKLEMHEDYRVRAADRFAEAIKENNYVGTVARFLPALNRTVMKPLFETYIPRLKVGMFLRDYAFELERRSADLQSGKISRGELARKTWEFVDDRFGELNWDNLFWDRTFKSGMQLLFRSVTWKLGNIRGFGKAGLDTVKELGRDWWKEGRAPRMTLPMGWFVGMSIVTAAQAAILTKVTTGKYPWELAADVGELMRNLTFPRIDLKDASQRVSIPTYWRDMVHLKHSPLDYVRSSMTGEIGRMADIWQNKDFYGTQVYNPDDPLYRKGLDAFEHMVPLPFGAQSFIAAQRTGETRLKSGLGFVGFTKAPYYISHTPAEMVAMEEMRRRVPAGARTKANYERSIQERKVIQAIRRGETTLRGAIADKLIDPRRAATLNTKLRETPLQYGVTHLDPIGAVRVWEKASPKERSEIERMVRMKILNSRSLTAEERKQLLARLQAEPKTAQPEANPFAQ